MPRPRQPLLDTLALVALWALALGIRAQLDLYWPFDLLPNTQVLQPVSAENSAWMGLVLVPTWLALLGFTGSWRRRAPIQNLGTATALATLIALSLFELLRITPVSRSLILGFAVATLPVLALTRWRPAQAHRVLLLGEVRDLQPWREVVEAHPAWGIEVVAGPLPLDSPHVLAVATETRVDEIYVAGDLEPDRLHRISAITRELDIALSVDANFLGNGQSQAQLCHFGDCTLITFASPPSAPAARATKRAIDLLLASILLVLSAPVVALAALAIRLEDGGPVWFVQPRVGQHGRPFPMFKLRSMVPDAALQRHSLTSEVPGPVFKLRADPRITRIGQFLRRSSIDELPQLLNVLRGEMSLVGPRPPLASEVSEYAPWQLRRLSVPPGMTGLWQVSGRSDVAFDQWMALDLQYVDQWSIWLDFQLILRTIPAVLSGAGAR